MTRVENLNVAEFAVLSTPGRLQAEIPRSDAVSANVVAARQAIRDILSGRDPRLLVVVGPCSIHDPVAALEYAGRLAALRRELATSLYIVMRVYFEKPRTTIGWKGLIYDPRLDDSADIEQGLRAARKLLLEINALGVPAGTEILDPIVPQYIADLVSWASIGARTTESQIHRQMASGLSMPVGFKNRTDGNLQVAIDAMESARHTHVFLGIDHEGRSCIVRTAGNPWGHLVLRGSRSGPNFDARTLHEAVAGLKAAGLPPLLMVDCSHGNTGRNFRLQEHVFQSCLAERVGGNRALIGVLIESHLNEGSQKISSDPTRLRYGVSITDACVGWDTTAGMLRQAAAQLAAGTVPGGSGV